MSTYLMAGLTILLAAGFATLVFTNLDADASAPRTRFDVDAAAGVADVAVTHAGGEILDYDALRFGVSVNGSARDVASTTKTGHPDRVAPGDVVTLTLAAPVPAGATVAVTVTDLASRHVLTTPTRSLGLEASPLGSRAPVVANVTVTPDPAPADGSTPVTVTARVDAPHGFLLVDRVRADLTPLHLGVVDLVDDGALGDAAPLDGVFTRTFTIPAGVPLGNHTLEVTALAADGAYGNRSTLLEVMDSETWLASGGGSGDGDRTGTQDSDGTKVRIVTKVTTGIAFGGVPSSDNITRMTVSNISWDHAVPNLIQNDILILKVTDERNHSWTNVVLFEPVNGRLGVKELVIYSALGGCSWAPRAFELTGPIDLLDPRNVTDLGLGSGSSSNIPTGIPPGCDEVAPGILRASYRNAAVEEPATLTILRLGENTGADEKTALINTDVYYE